MPLCYLHSTLSGEIHRTNNTCASELDLNKALGDLKSNFINNSYPPKMVEQKLDEIRKRNFSTKKSGINSQNSTPNKYKSSPSNFKLFLDFTSKRCEKVIKPLKSILNTITPNFNLHIIWKTVKLSKFITPRLKPNSPVFAKTHGIYAFTCDCDMTTYIGETKRTIKTRIMEHRPYNTAHKKSNIKDHLLQPCEKYFSNQVLLHGQNPTNKEKDEFFLSHFKVISCGLTNYKDRKYQEAIQISINNSTLNIQKESAKLQLFNV